MSSCKDLCCRPSPYCPDICPDPYVVAHNEPCITSCGDSTAVVHPPPVSVLFPGPILSTLPQHSVVGSILPAIPYGAGGSFGSGTLGGSVSYDGAYGGGLLGGLGGSYGSLSAYGGFGGYRGLSCYGGFHGYGRRCGRKSYFSRCGYCQPC